MDWDFFMDSLLTGQIVPVIGSDLIQVLDKNDKPVSLQSYLAQELTSKLKVEYNGQNICFFHGLFSL